MDGAAFVHRDMPAIWQQPITERATCNAARRIAYPASRWALPGLPNARAEPEASGKRAKALGIFARQVRHQTLAAAHHGEQAAARVVVVLVHAQMLAQLVDAPREDGDLHFW